MIDDKSIKTGDVTNSVINNGKVRDIFINVTSEEKKTLAQAAKEIQELLEELATIYPTETLSEQAVVAEEAIKRIQRDPTLKERVVSSIKAMGVEALMQTIDHPVANVFRAGLEKFKEPS